MSTTVVMDAPLCVLGYIDCELTVTVGVGVGVVPFPLRYEV